MFRFVSGRLQNLPFVYSGNIALMPPKHETIPIGTNDNSVESVEAYLIETRAINGASGSPVFVRPSFSLRDFPAEFPVRDVIIAHDTFHLLGVFTRAWFLPPDHILRKAISAREQDIVPAGFGVVVPAYKIIELLESDPVRQKRDSIRIVTAARQAGLQPERQPKSDENPSHKEDFTALLNAAMQNPQSND